jgi:hypothetical protein
VDASFLYPGIIVSSLPLLLSLAAHMHYRQLKLAAVSVWAAAVACRDVSAPSLGLETRGDSLVGGVNYTQLAKKLSKNAHIYLPGSDAFDAAVARWSNLSAPVANVVVVPSSENDVVETVSLLFHIPPDFPFARQNGLLIFPRLRSTSQTSTRCRFSPPMVCMDPSPHWGE